MTEINKLLIFSRQEVQRAIFKPYDYVVSIFDPSREQPKITGTNHKAFMAFHDVEEPLWVDGLIKYYPMMSSDANTVAILLKHFLISQKQNNYEGFFAINCEAGISRSAGIALGIANYFITNTDLIYQKRQPNQHCAKLTFNALCDNNIEKQHHWLIRN